MINSHIEKPTCNTCAHLYDPLHDPCEHCDRELYDGNDRWEARTCRNCFYCHGQTVRYCSATSECTNASLWRPIEGNEGRTCRNCQSSYHNGFYRVCERGYTMMNPDLCNNYRNREGRTCGQCSHLAISENGEHIYCDRTNAFRSQNDPVPGECGDFAPITHNRVMKKTLRLGISSHFPFHRFLAADICDNCTRLFETDCLNGEVKGICAWNYSVVYVFITDYYQYLDGRRTCNHCMMREKPAVPLNKDHAILL